MCVYVTCMCFGAQRLKGCRERTGSHKKPYSCFLLLMLRSPQEESMICWKEARAQHPRLRLRREGGQVVGSWWGHSFCTKLVATFSPLAAFSFTQSVFKTIFSEGRGMSEGVRSGCYFGRPVVSLSFFFLL